MIQYPANQPSASSLAMENTRRAQWQSAHRLKDPPQLTDLAQLARAIRQWWPR
jgi:hypothetical protein